MLDDTDIDLLELIFKKFENGELAETRTRVFNREPLWPLLSEKSLDCNTLCINSPYSSNNKRTVIHFPDNLGDFLNDISGNSIKIATWLLENQLRNNTIKDSKEDDEYINLLNNIHFLKALRIQVFNAKKSSNKHDIEPKSPIPEWPTLLNYYNYHSYIDKIHWDIDGKYRLKNLPYPKGNTLKKELLLERCMLCHKKQIENTVFCETHENKSTKLNSELRIKNAYKYLFDDDYTPDHHDLSVFIKSYELHTWAKKYTIHKLFRSSIMSTAIKIINEYPEVNYLTHAKHKNIIYILEKTYRRHPYIIEFTSKIDFYKYNLIEAIHSIILESEHSIIKVAASPKLRTKYSFEKY